LKKCIVKADTRSVGISERLKERGLLDDVVGMCLAQHATFVEIAGRSRTKAVVRARHDVWRFLHDERGLSWPEVARLFGRSHDSIIHAKKTSPVDPTVDKIARWLEDDELLDEDPRGFVDAVDRARLAGLIRWGAWR
jgi:hypothetical protein